MKEDNILSVYKDVTIRPITPADSILELTDLLHRSYKILADMGLRFFATYQTPEQTLERISDAYCLIGLKDGRMVATISYYSPAKFGELAWYDEEDVAHFGQFAVEPELRYLGLGGHLMSLIEDHARQQGVKELALDTSEKAYHLREYYEKRGYRFIQYHQWGVTNYRSVVMSKTL